MKIFKNIMTLFLSTTILLSSVSEINIIVKAEERNFSELKIIHEQTNIPNYSGYGLAFEVEDLQLVEGMTVIEDERASNGTGVWMGVRNPNVQSGVLGTPPAGYRGAIEARFVADETAVYKCYARVFVGGAGNDSCFGAVKNDEYQSLVCHAAEFYYWMSLPVAELQAGEEGLFRIFPRESGQIWDQIVITRESGLIPSGIVTEVTPNMEMDVYFGKPPYYPEENQHPRVMFQQKDVERLRNNLTHEQNKRFYDVFLEYIALDTTNFNSSAYNENITMALKSKAYYYALHKDLPQYSNRAKALAREAIETLLRVGIWEFTGASDYRQPGNMLVTAGCIYDWCYDEMNDSERKEFIDIAINWGRQMEVGWPITFDDILSEHGAEASVLRDWLTFAIAVADERKDIYEHVASGLYYRYYPVRQIVHKGHMSGQGANYGPFRLMYDAHSWYLITGMGAPEPFSGKELSLNAMSHNMYAMLPDGQPMKDGDVNSTIMNYYRNWQFVFMAANMGKNKFLKDRALTMMRFIGDSGNDDALAVAATNCDVITCLIINDVDLENETYSSLPLSAYFSSPNSTMIARTGWEEGVNAPVAVAEMKVAEFVYGGHQHRDHGTFQLFYKGYLTTDSGHYAVAGDAQHTNYTTRTIADNGLLIKDPDEDKNTGGGLDGGQEKHYGIFTGNESWSEKMSNPDLYRVTTVEGHEIDPQNPWTPEYSYIKGDITGAYSDKVSEVKRSMMFLNLFDEEVPAAMVVFDKITSTNPSFEKTWLLHTHTKPTTIENRTVSYATEGEEEWGESFQGKLTVDHLLPKLDDMTIETVGSEEEGFQTIDGVQYDSTAPYIGENSVQSTYRLEISPKTQKETDYFLNVLQVTDKETSGYENVKMLETDSLYGVSIKDRVVYFSKSGERENSFTINDNSLAGNKKYTFCDAQAGVWEVSTNGNTFNVNVTEDGGVLSFDSISGNIRAERKTDLDINIEEINPDDYLTGEIKNPNLSDKDRDIMLTYQQDYVYMENKPVIIDNKLMVDADRIAEVMGLEVERLNDSQIKLYCPQQNIAITLNIDSTVYEDNGVTMVELTTITDFFNHQTWWDELTKTVHLIPKRINFIPTNISVKWYGDSTSISEEHTFEISNSKIDIFLTKTKDELEKKITSQAQRLSIDLEFEGSARSNEDGTTVDFTVIPNKEFDINKYNSVIAAFYNNKGTLLDCKAVVINENVGLASSDIKADYVKLFFWRNRNFSPRAMSKTINVIAN